MFARLVEFYGCLRLLTMSRFLRACTAFRLSSFLALALLLLISMHGYDVEAAGRAGDALFLDGAQVR